MTRRNKMIESIGSNVGAFILHKNGESVFINRIFSQMLIEISVSVKLI